MREGRREGRREGGREGRSEETEYGCIPKSIVRKRNLISLAWPKIS